MPATSKISIKPKPLPSMSPIPPKPPALAKPEKSIDPRNLVIISLAVVLTQRISGSNLPYFAY